MKNFLLLLALSSTPVWAAGLACAPQEDGLPKLLTEIAKNNQDPRLLKYSENDKKEYKIVRLDSMPSKVTPTSVVYELEDQKLKPGECAYFMVPEDLRNKAVLFVNLGHTQTDEDNTGYDESTKWDSSPGLTTVQLNKTNDKGESQWRYWNGMSSGKYGAKFAEPGHMELEGLYEWYHNGHSDVKTNTKSRDVLNVDAMRLCSVGKDVVTIGSLALKVSPGVAAKYEEYNIGAGNKMGDSVTAEGRSYGSKAGAITLNGANKGTLLPGWQMGGEGELSLPLEKGKTLKSFEVAIGDAHADGSSGYASLDVFVKKKDGSEVRLIEDENLPPQGVIIGAPEKKVVIEDGDRLVLRANSDAAAITGMKIGLD